MTGFFTKIKRRICWQIFSLLPKNRCKVVLQSYYGRGYSDNPRAIAEVLLNKGGFRLYWTVKRPDEAKSLPPEITPLLIDSVSSIYHLCTAGFWIDNSRKWSFTRKRGKQYYIQTWHGFPLKRIEKDAGDALPPDYIVSAKHDSSMCDLFLSNSRFLSEIYRSGFWYEGDIMEMGFPRNDVLLHGEAARVKKARDELELPEDLHILLYAPTFRKGMELSVYDMDYSRCVAALEQSFGGKWLILAKLHPNIAEQANALSLDPDFVCNASAYPDIQDLYLLADAMITDYSSVMFDFLVTKKPCFLYVNDLAAYKDDRNFYFDIERLPFSRAENNEELVQVIRSHSEARYQADIEAFIQAFGINETGQAAKAVVKQMERIRNEA